MNPAKTADSGTQVVARTAEVLRAVARAGRGGVRLVDLPEQTGLSRPTIYRLLQSLATEDFVSQLDNKRYTLGPALFELGLAAPSPVGDLERFRAVIQRLAERCGDVAYLAIRRGDHAFYLVHAEGAYPIRTYTVETGGLLPLPESYGGLALLATMEEDEARAIIERTTPDQVTERLRTVRRVAEMLRSRGYAGGHDLVLGGVAGIAGLAALVPTPTGHPYLVVTLSTIGARMPEERIDALGRMLVQTAQEVAGLVGAGGA